MRELKHAWFSKGIKRKDAMIRKVFAIVFRISKTVEKAYNRLEVIKRITYNKRNLDYSRNLY